MSSVLAKKWGILIKKESESLIFTGLKIPRDYYCALGAEEKEKMQYVYEKKRLTARAYHRMLKVARTIADLDGSDQIGMRHLNEAVFYRPSDLLM